MINSLGNLVHHEQEGIDNFQRWFWDSKVVDDEGRPLVVFHGTNHEFSRFDQNRLGYSVDNPTTAFGHYFSSDCADALFWADRAVARRRAAIGSQHVLPVYLSIKNPKVLTPEKFHYYLQTARESTIASHLESWKQAGYDGIITCRGEGSSLMWYVAFEPCQIKSAIGNSGRFDPASDCMLDRQEARKPSRRRP